MMTNIKIDFVLFGTAIAPKEISRMTGIVPTTALLQGERNAELILPRRNLWSIESDAESDEITDHWAQLGPKLLRAQEILKDIARTGSAKISIVVPGAHRLPSIMIPPSMSAFAGYLGAVIDIDHLQS